MFTGCTSVMCGATSVSAPSPSARRPPSPSVAHGSGSNKPPATRLRATTTHSGVSGAPYADSIDARMELVRGGGGVGGAGDVDADLGAGQRGLGLGVIGVGAQRGFGGFLRPLRPMDVDLLRQLGHVRP